MPSAQPLTPDSISYSHEAAKPFLVFFFYTKFSHLCALSLSSRIPVSGTTAWQQPSLHGVPQCNGVCQPQPRLQLVQCCPTPGNHWEHIWTVQTENGGEGCSAFGVLMSHRIQEPRGGSTMYPNPQAWASELFGAALREAGQAAITPFGILFVRKEAEAREAECSGSR